MSDREYSRGQKRRPEISERRPEISERRPNREIREVREIREIKEYGESSGRQVSRENIERREKKRVLVLDGVRIFLDEIKRYGIATKKDYAEKIFIRESLIGIRRNENVREIYRDTGYRRGIDKDRYNECNSHDTCEILLKDIFGNASYWHFDKRASYQIIGNSYVDDLLPLYSDEFVYYTKDRYLYINTYKKNYTFWEDSVRFDIDQKCSEIDDWFNS